MVKSGNSVARRGPGVAAVAALLAAVLAIGSPIAGGAGPGITGLVESGSTPLAGFQVTLYRTVPDGTPVSLGTAQTDASGTFSLSGVDATPGAVGVYYLLARSGSTTPIHDVVTLATVFPGAPGSSVTINPRTTVAAAYSMAQFLHDGVISGSRIGVRNAASMTPNVADPVTGAIGAVLNSAPNGTQTSAVQTFNSLANVLAACVTDPVDCEALRSAATPAGGEPPADSLQALRDLVVAPSHNVADIFTLSEHGPQPYAPARSDAPSQWTLALRFDGAGTDLEGPGNFALDHEGNMWVASNYNYAPPGELACASDKLFRFSPDGSYYPGSPYTGGGLSGAGYGIAIDPYGDVWTSNFGFGATQCTQQPPHNTLSRFTSDGVAVSPSQGYTINGGDWPQAMKFDGSGNLWIANCASNSLTYLPGGDPSKARIIGDIGVSKPFDLAFGSDGNTYVTGSESNNIAVIKPDGTPARAPLTGYNRPMAITSDAAGSLWIANSGIVDLPCPDKDVTSVPPASVGYIDPATGERATYTGGGVTVPWGISVDGQQNVWVADFGGGRISEFCGRDDSPYCPAGAHKGTPISPDDTGYQFDGLRRTTAAVADTAGNLWVTNNWKTVPTERNPGGYEVVVFLGIAGPVQSPAPKAKPGRGSNPTTAPPAQAVATTPKFTG